LKRGDKLLSETKNLKTSIGLLRRNSTLETFASESEAQKVKRGFVRDKSKPSNYRLKKEEEDA